MFVLQLHITLIKSKIFLAFVSGMGREYWVTVGQL